MTWNRYAKRVDANQADIIAALEAAGVIVEPVGRPFDLLCRSSGRFWFVECKTDAGRMTKAQKRFMAKFEQDEAIEVWFCKTPQAALEAVVEIRDWR